MALAMPDKGSFTGTDAVPACGFRNEHSAAFTVIAGDRATWGGEAIFLDGEPARYASSGDCTP